MKNRFSKIIVGMFFFCILFPLVLIFILSFAKNWRWPLLFPKNFGLRSWKYFFDVKTKSLIALGNSCVISLAVTILTFAITMPAAKAAAFYQFKLKRFFELLFFLPLVIPPVTLAMGLHIEFIKLNLANNFFGVILINIFPCIPYSFFILKSGFALMGETIELQAKTLGANPFQVLYTVTLPLLLPSIITAAVMLFIISFSQYFLSFCIGGGRVLTFPILMVPFIQSGDRMLGCTFSVVFIIVLFLIMHISEKLIARLYKKRFGAVDA
ncbi:MAG: ABC transporter permease subunit [Treponemataceae bacterium]